MSLMIHVINRCYQKAFIREKIVGYIGIASNIICENDGIKAINKTGLDYFTEYFCQSGVFPHSLVCLSVCSTFLN